MFLRLAADGTVEEVSFTGQGCAISQATASMMTLKVKGRPVAEVLAMMEDFRRVVTGDGEPVEVDRLGELQLLEGVQKFPQRVKCAMLSWRALEQILVGAG